MLSYYLECRKNTESKHPRVAKTNKKKQCFYQNVQCGAVKNMNSLRARS